MEALFQWIGKHAPVCVAVEKGELEPKWLTLNTVSVTYQLYNVG